MSPEVQRLLDALVQSPAYWNTSDPQHEIVKDKVSRVYAIEHEGANGNAEMHGRRPAAIVIDTSK